MRDLASTLANVPETHRTAAWAGHEYVKGWAVFALPFDSGHVLALRVMPEANLDPYRSLWHRSPEGGWAVYVDAPGGCACTRYFSEACELTAHSRIDVEWIGPASVHVSLDQPSVDWTFAAASDWRFDLVNAVNGRLPLGTWRSNALVRARELAAKAMGLGDLELTGLTPSGNRETLMPEQIYRIDESHAVFDGVDLGHPTQFRQNPRIGSVPMPKRGILAVGQGMWRMSDAIPINSSAG
jgi:hypothetical protein